MIEINQLASKESCEEVDEMNNSSNLKGRSKNWRQRSFMHCRCGRQKQAKSDADPAYKTMMEAREVGSSPLEVKVFTGMVSLPDLEEVAVLAEGGEGVV